MRLRSDLLDAALWEGIEGLVCECTAVLCSLGRQPHRRGTRQAQRRLALAEVEQLVAGYLAGATASELAAASGIHRTTALALLERNRVPRRGRVWNPELTEQATRLYAEGRSCAAIARRLKMSPETVRQHLLAAGVALRPPGSIRS